VEKSAFPPSLAPATNPTQHQKNKVEKVENFQPPNKHHQLTTIHHDPTTNSPSKTTRWTLLFPKYPSKTPVKQQNPSSHRGFIFS
jgi:hypothetical protein